jgi:hypothetical protein
MSCWPICPSFSSAAISVRGMSLLLLFDCVRPACCSRRRGAVQAHP